ncbi:hypothetical protein AGMMS49975_28830 [Clostridia bacterium]|nr:hypothetical protein AGMMS49975_28830 [Clostridia bacterium]
MGYVYHDFTLFQIFADFMEESGYSNTEIAAKLKFSKVYIKPIEDGEHLMKYIMNMGNVRPEVLDEIIKSLNNFFMSYGKQ